MSGEHTRAEMLAAYNSEMERRGLIRETEEETAAERDLKHERDLEQAITERDAAEECVSDIYYKVIGQSPEWSNEFGFKEALDDIEGAVNVLKMSVGTLVEASETIRAEKAELVAALRPYVDDGHCPTCDNPGECNERIPKCAWECARAVLAKATATEGGDA